MANLIPHLALRNASRHALLAIAVSCAAILPARAAETTTTGWSLTGTGNSDSRNATNALSLSGLGVTAKFPVGGAPGFLTPPVFQPQPASMASGGIGAFGSTMFPYRAVNSASAYQSFGAGGTFPTGAGVLGINTFIGVANCTRAGSEANRVCGRLVVTFSQPVRNPTMHFVQMGGGGTTLINPAFDPLAPPSGATPTWVTAAANATPFSMNMLVTSTRAGAAGGANAACNGTSADPNGTNSAVCGSASLVGTNSVFNFNLVKQYWGAGATTTGDGFRIQWTVDHDFGDAPASYDAGTATAHVLSDLALGTSTAITAEYSDRIITATTLSPNSNATASGDADDNAFPSALANVNGSATSHAITVPVSDVSKAARLCGYIDFNRDGDFGDAGEQACGNAASGASNVALSWTLPAGTAYVAGNSYVRFRLGYNTAQVQSPTGMADSGEAEDYQIVLLPRVRVVKTLSPSTDAGVFNLSLSPTILPAGSATATNVGNGGTTGFATVSLGTNVSFSETAGTATNLASYSTTRSCVNRGGDVVLASVVGTSGAFTSMTSASTSANATPATQANIDNTEVTCTLANDRLAGLTITKISNGSTGTFNFTHTNTNPGTSSITTTASGAPGTTGGTLAIVSNGTQIQVTEAAVAGWRLDSIVCTKLTGGGQFAPQYDVQNRRVTIPNNNVNAGATFAVHSRIAP